MNKDINKIFADAHEEYWRSHPLTEEEKNQYKEVLQNLREKNKNKHNTEE